jgi:hypothetical protein
MFDPPPKSLARGPLSRFPGIDTPPIDEGIDMIAIYFSVKRYTYIYGIFWNI